jgi:hypothetical protein
MKLRSAQIDDVHQVALVEFERSRVVTRLINGLYELHHAILMFLIRRRTK